MREKASVILSMVIFGTIGIFVEYIDLPSGVIASFRGITGAIVILAVMLLSGKKIDFKSVKKKIKVLVASGVAIGFNWILLFEAYKFTGIPVATVCYYTAPVIVVVASSFVFKKKLKAKQIICVLLAMVGVGAVSGVLGEGATDMKGVLCGLGAALLYASVMIMNKFMGDVPSYERTVVQLFVAGVVVLPYAILSAGEIKVNVQSALLLVVVGVGHTGFAYLLYFGAMKKLESSTVAILSYIDPASAIILSSLVFMSLPKPYEIVGVIFIMTGAIWSEMEIKTQKNSAE